MKSLMPVLASIFLLPACSSVDDDPPETAEAFCERWAAAACSDEVRSACQAASLGDCRESQQVACLGRIPASGFSGLHADRCIDAVEAAYADADIDSTEVSTVLRLGAPCDQLVRGPNGEGEACSSRLDCEAPDGFDCVFKADQSGTCQRPVAVGAGEDCAAPEAVCPAGFYCNGANCIAGERPGDPCASHLQCGATGFCGASDVCEERLPVNEPCGFDEQCTSGFCYEFSATERVCTDRLRLSRSEPLCLELR